MSLRDIGYGGEQVVVDYYTGLGYTVQGTNVTYKGGELDCVFSKDKRTVFVEVKVVDHIDDLSDYITPTKLSRLQHSIQLRLQRHDVDEYRLDVVYIKQKKVYHVVEGVEV